MEGLFFETEFSNKVNIFQHILVHNYLFYESDDATKGDNSSVGEGDQVVRHLLSCEAELYTCWNNVCCYGVTLTCLCAPGEVWKSGEILP